MNPHIFHMLEGSFSLDAVQMKDALEAGNIKLTKILDSVSYFLIWVYTVCQQFLDRATDNKIG